MTQAIHLIVGNRFNDWTVVSNDVKYINGIRKYLCKCKCGKLEYLTAGNLKNNRTKRCRSCSSSGENNGFFTGYKDLPGAYFYRIIKRCTNQKKFNIKDLYNLYIKQNKKCAITKLDISFKDKTASLDRIDSSKEYTLSNVHWVHKDVNIMKNGYELNYFLWICKLIYDNNKNIKYSKISNFKFGTRSK